MEFTAKLAGLNVGISSMYDEIYDLCHDYLTDDKSDFCISATAEDIRLERLKNFREAQIERIPFVDHPDSYLETLAVYRKIATQMLEHDTFLMHGAVVAVGEKAWLFTAASGTGKTTHIRLRLDNIENSYVVNGDKPLIHIGETVTVYGTPWAGKEGMQKNVGVDLCGIVSLERGPENRIERTAFPQIMSELIQQVYRPKDKTALEKTLKLLRELGGRIPLYRLSCNMDPEAAFTAYETLNRNSDQYE